ncbi:MAG TPA: hypothetical protein VFB50_10295 [Chloroflexota bacterium]|nr:hypothetical protein [Chloroflexota bacterium]
MQVEILTYAPTEFYHCQHCEVVWDQVGLGRSIRADQRGVGLPPDLQAEYEAISDWVDTAHRRYGEQLRVTLVDVASLEGVFKAVRHRARRFPAFIVNGTERIVGFDRAKLDSALDRVAGKEGEVAY